MASTANGADALTREMSAALNAEKDTAGPEDDAMTPEQVMRSISKRAEQSQKSRTTRTSYELVDQASPIRRSQTHGNLGRRPRTSPSTGGSHKVVSKAATQHGMQCHNTHTRICLTPEPLCCNPPCFGCCQSSRASLGPSHMQACAARRARSQCAAASRLALLVTSHQVVRPTPKPCPKPKTS